LRKGIVLKLSSFT